MLGLGRIIVDGRICERLQCEPPRQT